MARTKNRPYTPPQKILERYADVLVNFALNSGKGIKRGEVVRLTAGEFAKPLYMELHRSILKAGGHVLANYFPDDDSKSFNPSRDFFELANDAQLTFFPKTYLKGLVDTIDHSLYVIADVDKEALKGVDPKKMMLRGEVYKPYKKWLEAKENSGKFTWTVALYGTPAGAREARLSERAYWNQIIKACFLDKRSPVTEWRKVQKQMEVYRKKLNQLDAKTFHVYGPDVDLRITFGEKRKWMGGSGRNIPSFELFCSPDWRGTEGWIKFNQPLYRYGNLITGIELEFENGRVVTARAQQNQHVLREMIKTTNADKVGEFSMTDRRFSRITKFMAETLFDENMGGVTRQQPYCTRKCLSRWV
ncbi:aminopeptidase [Candidatus Wolfebacteria bacterium]|nr:aminopeptidase [Candidatus Wolfebacteria bacterium]